MKKDVVLKNLRDEIKWQKESVMSMIIEIREYADAASKEKWDELTPYKMFNCLDNIAYTSKDIDNVIIKIQELEAQIKLIENLE